MVGRFCLSAVLGLRSRVAGHPMGSVAVGVERPGLANHFGSVTVRAVRRGPGRFVARLTGWRCGAQAETLPAPFTGEAPIGY